MSLNLFEEHEIAAEAIKAAPPLTVVSTSLIGGIAWHDVAYACTALWFAVQTLWFIGVRIWRWKNGKPLDTVKG